jgi:hypothetical protein
MLGMFRHLKATVAGDFSFAGLNSHRAVAQAISLKCEGKEGGRTLQ